MTAFDLIESIFSRVQAGVPGNERRVSPEQQRYLRDLIDEDPEGGAFRPDGPGRMVWAPSGRHKYILTEGTGPGWGKLTRLSSLNASAMGRLF
jgi:hypothetical protein